MRRFILFGMVLWVAATAHAQIEPMDAGDAALDARDYRAAVEHFTAAIEAEPDNVNAYNGRAEAHYYLGNDEAALADYDRMIALEPKESDWYVNRAFLHTFVDMNAAVRDASTALAMDPDNFEAYRVRAVAYANLGEVQAMLGDVTWLLSNFGYIDQSWELTPAGDDLVAQLGAAETLTVVEQLASLGSPDSNVALLAWRGDAHYALGNGRAAFADYWRYGSLAPFLEDDMIWRMRWIIVQSPLFIAHLIPYLVGIYLFVFRRPQDTVSMSLRFQTLFYTFAAIVAIALPLSLLVLFLSDLPATISWAIRTTFHYLMLLTGIPLLLQLAIAVNREAVITQRASELAHEIEPETTVARLPPVWRRTLRSLTAFVLPFGIILLVSFVMIRATDYVVTQYLQPTRLNYIVVILSVLGLGWLGLFFVLRFRKRLNNRWLRLMSRGDVNQAVAVMGRLHERQPDNPEIIFYHGTALHIRGDDAEPKLREVLRHPKATSTLRALAMGQLGLFCAQAGRHDEALELGERGIELLLTGFLHSTVAEIHIRAGDPDRAIALCDEGLGLMQPNSLFGSDLNATKAWALAEAGRDARVHDVIAQALKVRTRNRIFKAGRHDSIARAYAALGEDDKAAEHHAQAAALAPGSIYDARQEVARCGGPRIPRDK